MKRILIAIALAGFFMVSLNLSANPIEKKYQQAKLDTLKKDGIDPVCGMKVKAGNTRTFTYNKALYGFCSEGCKKKFVAEPAKYIKK